MKKKIRASIFLLVICLLLIPAAARAAQPKLSRKKVTLTAGKSCILEARNTKKKVTWKTSKRSVASVKRVGRKKARLTARKKGTAKITAVVGKKRLVCKVTVKAKKKKTGNHAGGAASGLEIPKLKEAKAAAGYIRVSWHRVAGARQYEILRKTDGGWQTIGAAKAPQVSYTDTDVENGVRYTYTVRAVDGSKKSRYDEKGVSAVADMPQKNTDDGTEDSKKPETPGTEGERETETEETYPIGSYADCYIRDIGSNHHCWLCNPQFISFYPAYIGLNQPIEYAVAWLNSYEEDEIEATAEWINRSGYSQELKDALLGILYGEIPLTEELRKELRDRVIDALNEHCDMTDGCEATANDMVLYRREYEMIPASQYDEWKKDNYRVWSRWNPPMPGEAEASEPK